MENNKQIQLISHGALFLANLIYALNYTIAKGVMPAYIDPLGFILLRVSGACILFWILHAFFPKDKVAKKDFIKLFICGVFGVALNQMMFFKGLNLTTPINAAVTMTSTPILVIIMASIIIKEKLNLKRITGIALGAAGAITLITQGEASISETAINPTLGNTFIFINAASYALYLLFVKPLMAKYEALTVIKWVFTFGLLIVLPFGLTEFTEVDWFHLPTKAILALSFVVICTTFMAYLFNVFALKNLRASTVGFYIYLQPLLATAVAIMSNSDQLDLIKILASVLIFTGVFLVSGRKKSTASE